MPGTSLQTSCEWQLAGAAPRFATPRNPLLRSDGAQVGVVARSLGTPLIPWQQYTADVATERNPDGSYRYPVVVVSVPRQSGKTTLLRAVGVQRCLVCGRDVFYTAQTGKDARARWTDLVQAIRVAPGYADQLKAGGISVRVAAGSEAVTFPSGAQFRAFAPTPESLHGYTPPTVMLDEAFAHSAMLGELLMGAIEPAQFTIVDRQLWIVSTAGTAESTFLHDWIDRGMAGAEGVAVFLWAAADDHDLDDPADVAAYHPAVGFELNGKTLTAQDVIGAAAKVSRAEYERAYGNRRTLTASNLLPLDLIRALAAPDVPTPPTDQLVLSYDVAHDRQSASVVASWRHDGITHHRVVMAGPGYAWLAPAVADLDDSWQPRALVADDGGHAREVTAELVAAGRQVRTTTLRELATATGGTLRAVHDDDLTHDGSVPIVQGFAGLATRPTTDGEVVSRRHSQGDVSAAVAAIVGGYVLDQLPDDQPVTIVWAS